MLLPCLPRIKSQFLQICSCAACLPPIMNILLSLGVCVTPPKNETEGNGGSCSFVASRTVEGNRTGTVDGTLSTSDS